MALGVLYTRLCVLAQSRVIIYWLTVSVGYEIGIIGRKVQLNKFIKPGKPCCLQTSDM